MIIACHILYQATDLSPTAPHNTVRYSLLNHLDQFIIDERSGKVFLRKSLIGTGIDR